MGTSTPRCPLNYSQAEQWRSPFSHPPEANLLGRKGDRRSSDVLAVTGQQPAKAVERGSFVSQEFQSPHATLQQSRWDNHSTGLLHSS